MDSIRNPVINRENILPKRCKNATCSSSLTESCNSAAARPWKHNWDTDKQPVENTVEGYIETAHALREELIFKIKPILASAPNAFLKYDKPEYSGTNKDGERYNYYKLSDIDDLIDQLNNSLNDPHFLKSLESSKRKECDESVGCDAAKIKDYLRFQIVTNDVEEIARMRDDLINSQGQITSYKDQFRRPCPEGGHRAFKFHMLIEKDGMYMVAEGQIGHKGLEELDLPKSLRESERSINKANLESSKQSLRPIWNEAVHEATTKLMALRRAINYDFCRDHGLDVLLDNDISPEKEFNDAYRIYQCSSATDTTKKILKGIRSKIFPELCFHSNITRS